MWRICVLVALLGVGHGVSGQTCRAAAAQQCRERLLQIIQQHSQDFTSTDITSQCPTLRDNMACLLWQSANCQTREQQQRSGEHILAAKNFLDKYCDLDGGWRNSRCYQYDEVSRCENTFTQRRGADSCDAYNRFKDCVKSVLQSRCSRTEEQSFPAFLVERSRELAWTCASVSSDTTGRSYDRYDSNRNDNRYNNDRYGNDRYNSDQRLGTDNRYGNDRYGSSDRYGTDNRNNDRYGSTDSRYGSSDNRYGNDRYPNDRVNDNRYANDRLNNDRYRPGYTPGPVGTDADSYCLHKAQESIRDCDSNHQRRQYNARRYHADERIRESCCATVEYKSCLRNGLNYHCRDYGFSTVESIISQKTRDTDNDCRNFDQYRCTNAAVSTIVNGVAILFGLVIASRSLF